MKKELSFRKAALAVLISTLLISGSAALATLYYFHVHELQSHNAFFEITAISQTGKDKNRLPTAYLAELLSLSVDKSTNSTTYKTTKAEKKLRLSPVIKEAYVQKIGAHALAVEYTLRKPYFRLLNYENAAIDQTGVLFPLNPFFEETSLPELCLDKLESHLDWGSSASQQQMQLIHILVEKLNSQSKFQSFKLKRIDFANLNALSLGEREIVLILTDDELSDDWILRLSSKELDLQLIHFVRLRDYLKKNKLLQIEKIIDLRIFPLAFIAIKNH